MEDRRHCEKECYSNNNLERRISKDRQPNVGKKNVYSSFIWRKSARYKI
jgi:hypothetical protein